MQKPISNHRGFTMVELIVLLGMTSLLFSLMIPSLLKARQAAKRTMCLSNIRQIDLAMLQYCNDNKGFFPSAAAKDQQYEDDFIYWQQPKTAWDQKIYTGDKTRELDQSPLQRYMGRKFNAVLWSCPSDDAALHPKTKIGNDNLSYPYSYTMNALLSCELQKQDPVAFEYVGSAAVRMPKIRRPSETIMILEESTVTIDDGSTSLVGFNGPTFDKIVPGGKSGTEWLSARHDLNGHVPENDPLPGDADDVHNSQARGCVGFCDGHAEYTTRKYVHSVKPGHWDPSLGD